MINLLLHLSFLVSKQSHLVESLVLHVLFNSQVSLLSALQLLLLPMLSPHPFRNLSVLGDLVSREDNLSFLVNNVSFFINKIALLANSSVQFILHLAILIF
jgi:hypothetical protein